MRARRKTHDTRLAVRRHRRRRRTTRRLYLAGAWRGDSRRAEPSRGEPRRSPHANLSHVGADVAQSSQLPPLPPPSPFLILRLNWPRRGRRCHDETLCHSVVVKQNNDDDANRRLARELESVASSARDSLAYHDGQDHDARARRSRRTQSARN